MTDDELRKLAIRLKVPRYMYDTDDGLAALRAVFEAGARAQRDDPGTLKLMTSLVERAYGIFTASGVLRVVEQDPNSNDPIVAWASDVRSILYRNKPAAIDVALRDALAGKGEG